MDGQSAVFKRSANRRRFGGHSACGRGGNFYGDACHFIGRQSAAIGEDSDRPKPRIIHRRDPLAGANPRRNGCRSSLLRDWQNPKRNEDLLSKVLRIYVFLKHRIFANE